MKKLLFLTGMLLFSLGMSGLAQQKENPWTPKQLIEPDILAAQLKTQPKDQQPAVIDVGPAGLIKGAIEVGPAEDKEGIEKLKSVLKKLPKDKEIVIYCGCCPFSKCPNVRPAFKTLLEMGFTRPRLLNLSHNLKADWIDKGFPLQEE